MRWHHDLEMWRQINRFRVSLQRQTLKGNGRSLWPSIRQIYSLKILIIFNYKTIRQNVIGFEGHLIGILSKTTSSYEGGGADGSGFGSGGGLLKGKWMRQKLHEVNINVHLGLLTLSLEQRRDGCFARNHRFVLVLGPHSQISNWRRV